MILKKLLYNRREAAQKLGVSVVTLDRITKRGELRATRIGRRVCFSPYNLETFVNHPSVSR